MHWSELIQTEQAKEYFKKLLSFLATERNLYTIYPKNEDVFNAFKMTPFEEVRVVLIGQDPYHGPNQAMGLSFSVHKEVAVPKSLINIYKELKDDLNIENHHGDLSSWAKQGVLLLNTTLTVRAGEAFSHANQGWETFTSTMIEALCTRRENLVFILWGNHARRFSNLAQEHGHYVVESVHPSPLSAHRGFFGSRPFSKTNTYLLEKGKIPIDWSID